MPIQKLVIPQVPVVASESITVVTPPPFSDRQEWTAAMAGLISTLHHPFPEQRAVVEMIYNLICFGVPEVQTYVANWDSVNVVAVSPSREEFLTWAGILEGADARVNPALPALPAPPRAQAYGVTSDKAVYLALSSLVYSIGKQASEASKASAMDNRPDALIRRFGIEEGNQVLLPGKDAGPTREVLEQVYNSFANYSEIRTSTMVVFLSWRNAGAHLPINTEIIMTNFNLLRGAGMTHVESVMKLVQMHPWTLRVPELEPYYHHFLQELQAWEKIPADVRPYHRLLVPQAEYMFLSSEYRPLVAVAGSFISEVEKTFNGYVYNRAAYEDLIKKVHSYVPGYQPTQRLSQLAKLLNIPDEPLPPRAQAATTSTAAVV
jgi:hypothetical protein